jgi:hypothetical protein
MLIPKNYCTFTIQNLYLSNLLSILYNYFAKLSNLELEDLILIRWKIITK